ncbi:MAG: sigma-70 family RNA polymerase sigma factor [Akkermansia sp.]|nr:sigma-70 family RNA polymerase sigma factor [Akkermansia sp.]
MHEELPWKTPDDGELEKYADRTRRSLIARLHDWQDQRSWDEFYRTYWRLIYAVATQAGLRDDEAWDTVQETILTIAKQSRNGGYDPQKGSFKKWLWHITRWRIKDRLKGRPLESAPPRGDDDTEMIPDVGDLPDVNGESFESIWEREWQRNLIKAATERVKMQVNPKQFQIFDYYVLRGMSTLEVRRKLGVSLTQIYLARHRVSSLLKKEIESLRAGTEM